MPGVYTPAQLQAYAIADAAKYGVDSNVFLAQINRESGWNPNAVSSAGAIGIAQIMPNTAKGWGVDPTDPIASLDAAAKAMGNYLAQYGGDYRTALTAYNTGPGNVAKYGVDGAANLPGADPLYATKILAAAGKLPAQEAKLTPQNILRGVLENVWTGLQRATVGGIASTGVDAGSKAGGWLNPQTYLSNGGIALGGIVLVAVGGLWLIARTTGIVGKAPQIVAARGAIRAVRSHLPPVPVE